MQRLAGKASDEKRSVYFRPIVWVLLLAFTLQSFITQVHIHHASAGAIAQSVNVLDDAVGHSRAPDRDSKSDCPFCQAIVHAGAFFAPPQIFVPQIARVEIAPPVLVAIAIESFFPHPWYSRGPPLR